jgi:hypothetical protein
MRNFIEFPYAREQSDILGPVKRPRLILEIFSEMKKEWITIDEVLADTGADLTVLPHFIGEMLVEDITRGKYIEIKGVSPGAVLIAFVHNMRVRIKNRVFNLPIALADSNAVPAILGRLLGLDRFEVSFVRGNKTKIVF